MIRRPPRSTQSRSSAASDVYKRQTSIRKASFARNKGVRSASLCAALRPGHDARKMEGIEMAKKKPQKAKQAKAKTAAKKSARQVVKLAAPKKANGNGKSNNCLLYT